MEASLTDSEKAAEGDHVIACKDRRGAGNQPKQDQRLRVAAVFIEGGFLDILRSELELRFLYGTLETAEPLLGVRKMQWSSDHREPGVAHLEQAFGCIVGSRVVV